MSSWVRRHATTIALTALAAGGVAVLFAVDRGAVTTEEAEERKKNLLFVFRRDEISELLINARGLKARVFRGEPMAAGQRPWLVEIGGQRFAADEASVDQLLGSLELGVFERRVPLGSVDRAAVGLAAPRVAISLVMGGRSMKVAIGGPAPSPEGAVYAESDARGIVVITAQLAAALDKSPDGLRTKALMPYEIAELQSIELTGRGGVRSFERAAWGGSRGPGFRWSGRTPEGTTRVSEPAMARVLLALGGLEAEAFLSDEEADRALKKEVSIMAISRFADSNSAQIDVGGACPGHEGLVVCVQRSPARISACVSASALEGLSTPAEELVDRRLFAASFDAVVDVKLAEGGRSIELARRGGAWRMRSPAERDVEAPLGRGLVEGLLKVEATRVVKPDGSAPNLSAIGLSPPRATARLSSTTETSAPDGGLADDRVEVVEIGAEEGDIVHMRRVEDGALLDVPADQAAALFPSEISLRSREVVREPSSRFQSIRVRSGDRVQRLRRGDEGWELVEPKGNGLVADASFSNELAERLGALTASLWVDGKNNASLGLEKPRIVIEAELGDEGDEGARGDAGADSGAGLRALTLALGAPATDGSFARLGGDSAVFVAPKEIELAADRWLLDRGALRVDPAWIGLVTLKTGNNTNVEVERSGDVWRVRSGGEGSAAKAAAVRDALSDFTAEEAVTVGPPSRHEGLDKPALTVVINPAVGKDAPPSEGKREPVRIVIGAGDVWRGTRIYYARRSGVDATFAVAQAKVRPLLEAAGAR